jgi:hypothetical protein
VLPAPFVHADLASPPALSVANQDRSAPRVEVVLGERERLLDAQPGTPQHNDHRPQPPAVTVISGVAHHRDDLLHRRWVGRVAHPLVPRRAPGVVAGSVAGERRRPAESSADSTVMGPPMRQQIPALPTSRAAAGRPLSLESGRPPRSPDGPQDGPCSSCASTRPALGGAPASRRRQEQGSTRRATSTGRRRASRRAVERDRAVSRSLL